MSTPRPNPLLRHQEVLLRAELIRLWELATKPSPEEMSASTGQAPWVFTAFLAGDGYLTFMQTKAIAEAVAPRAARAQFVRRWRALENARREAFHSQEPAEDPEPGPGPAPNSPLGSALAASTLAGFAVALNRLQCDQELTCVDIADHGGGMFTAKRVDRFLRSGEAANERVVEQILRGFTLEPSERDLWVAVWRNLFTWTPPAVTARRSPATSIAGSPQRTMLEPTAPGATHEPTPISSYALVVALAGVSVTVAALTRRGTVGGMPRWLPAATGITAGSALLVIAAARGHLGTRPARDTDEART
ncbi:hypothetical protein [Amycolatopsis minnesotensis]|uniref:Uncharacterized protein n=1 Tax=Amycolatopsis minnesotensis TaxID=337894 RepID=A0ABN2SA36_9PSEU